jgi:RNA polymerase sigma-70 factor (ECF subfamily)
MIDNYTQVCDDKDLVHRLSHNDDAVFDVIYRKYWPVLTHVAFTYVQDRDTCNEIVQELFITLYKKRTRLNIKVSLYSYLYVSLRNRIRNHIRHQTVYNKHINVVKRSSPDITVNNVEQFMRLSELEKEIEVCLNGMPEKCKEVYLLYQKNQCTMKGIATILQRPVDTVEKQLRRAVLLLRSHLSASK